MAPTTHPAQEVGSSLSVPVAPAWAKRKAWNTRMAQAMATDAPGARTAADFNRCAERLGIRAAYVEGDALAMAVTAARFCQHRLCPVCAWRKASAWRRRLIPGLEAFHAAHPTHRAVFLTLTVRNCRVGDLRAALDELHKGWERMSRCSFFPTKFWLRRTELTVGQPPTGCEPSVISETKERAGRRKPTESQHHDITDNACVDSDTAMPLWVHPHLHVLMLVPASYFSHGYVKQLEWQRQWMMAARLDYAPVVDVRKAYVSRGVDDPKRATIGAAIEAAKYVGKPVDFLKHPRAVVDVEDQIRNVRMIGVSRPLGEYVKSGLVETSEMLDPVNPEDSNVWSSEVFASWDAAASAYFFES